MEKKASFQARKNVSGLDLRGLSLPTVQDYYDLGLITLKELITQKGIFGRKLKEIERMQKGACTV